MKLILLIYNAAIEAEVMECLAECEIGTYTKILRMHGTGTNSDPHLDSPVWPGFNNGLFIAVPDDRKEELLKKMKVFKQKNIKEGVKVLILPLEEVI